MIRYILIFISLIASYSLASGQEKIAISGKVTDKSSHEPVPFVHIINQNKGTGVASAVDGSFKLQIELGDTLIFSAVGYSKHSLVITKQLREVFLDIKLDTETMELKAVNVFAYKDLSALKKAIVEMDLPLEEETQIKFNLPTPADHSPGGGIVFTGPLTGIINGLGFNKRHNEVQKYNNLRIEEQRREKINQRYNAAIVKEWTDLQDEELESFMEFCKLSDDFILRSSEYNLAVAVHQCFDEFKEIRQDQPGRF